MTERIRVEFEANPALVDALDDAADVGGLSRAELIRRSLAFGLEAGHADSVSRRAELQSQIDELIETNQERRRIAKFPSLVRDLFAKDVRDDTDPAGLESIAAGLREQAALVEELADEVDGARDVEPGEYVGMVDEELAYAVEAVDVSAWYDDVENPHEAHLSGVREGRKKRQAAVSLVQGLVKRRHQIRDAFVDPANAPPLRVIDLPEYAGTVLPAGVEPQDVVDVVERLVEQGVPSEDVPDVLPTVDPELTADDDTDDDVDVDEQASPDDGIIRLGGRAIDAEESHSQRPLPAAVMEADGGRSAPARKAGWDETAPDYTDDMNPETPYTDSDSNDRDELEDEAMELIAELEAAETEASQ